MATAKRDYYEVLDVGREAGAEDIRKAFRKKAFELHPDRNKAPDAEPKFKELNEAYEVLRDAEKRAQYDRFGHASPGQGGAGFDGVSGFPDFGDIFDAFFGGTGAARGGRPGAQAAERGADLQVALTIEFDEAAFGTEKKFDINRVEACSRCAGSRSEPGAKAEKCAGCNGTGQVRQVQKSVFGQFVNVTQCGKCGGRGQIISNPCTACKGAGKERKQRTISVKIPAGVAGGSQIRLTGEGESGANGGPRGNLYVALQVNAHPLFDREGDDLVYALPITVAQAALGDEVEVPTLEGKTKLKVPPGTQPGSVFRLKGQGITHLRGHGRGDEIVSVDVVIPKTLSAKEKKLFQELSGSLKKPDMSKKDEGFFDRIKQTLG
ncbi:MAG: molecular chaperone DnaJ [Dehalococcoidia bacterium]|nr:molecular chaperone DnaJ [Dehalococcoidia bacterium]